MKDAYAQNLDIDHELRLGGFLVLQDSATGAEISDRRTTHGPLEALSSSGSPRATLVAANGSPVWWMAVGSPVYRGDSVTPPNGVILVRD